MGKPRTGKFELFKTSSKAEPWRWRLRAANGHIICQSEGYQTRSGCENGIQSMRATVPTAAVIDLT